MEGMQSGVYTDPGEWPSEPGCLFVPHAAMSAHKCGRFCAVFTTRTAAIDTQRQGLPHPSGQRDH